MFTIQPTHCIERTSPKGERFVGICVLCGEEGLRLADAMLPCPNPTGATEEATLVSAVEGKKH